MSANFTVNGNIVTINFSYSAPLQVAQDTIFTAAKGLIESGLYVVREPNYTSKNAFGETIEIPGAVIPFENLTAQQKLNVVDQFVLRSVQDQAWMQHKAEAAQAAAAAAEAEAQTKFL